MTLTFGTPVTALGFGSFINITASGGTPPYTYSLAPGGVGGSLIELTDGSVTYSAPSNLPSSGNCLARILAEDSEGEPGEVSIIVGDYQTIFCDIIQHELDIPGRVFLENQKVMWPKDDKLFITAGILTNRIVGNNCEYKMVGGNYSEIKTINAASTMSVNIYSRGLDALVRQNEVLMALKSTYSQQQQVRNGIRIAEIPSGRAIQNLSELDGDAILYRFHFDTVVYYSQTLIKAVDYFDKFQIAEKINA